MTGGLFGMPAGGGQDGPVQVPVRSAPAPRPPLTERARAHLVAAGHMDDLTGAVRKAHRGRCPVCRRPVWRGLQADWGAYAVDADVGPLTALGEAMARLSGWSTVTLRFTYDRFQIDLRDQWVIAGEPAGSRVNCDVLSVHRCGINPDHLPTGPSRIPIPVPDSELPINAPF